MLQQVRVVLQHQLHVTMPRISYETRYKIGKVMDRATEYALWVPVFLMTAGVIVAVVDIFHVAITGVSMIGLDVTGADVRFAKFSSVAIVCVVVFGGWSWLKSWCLEAGEYIEGEP